ncbi:MAG: hypothetical protein HZC11_08830 [Nitrospirae bacterium]|nr:hypothetical protein [Nitrospirota bacterium]
MFIHKLCLGRWDVAFERVFLPIVYKFYFKNKEAKASESRCIGTRMSENTISHLLMI